MSFYKEIAPFVEYVHSIRKLKNYLSFDMTFPTKWSLPKSIVDEAKDRGERERSSIVDKAKLEAKIVIENAHKEIDSEIDSKASRIRLSAA